MVLQGIAATFTNAQVAAKLGQLARLLQGQGANKFKVRAYLRAADALRSYPVKVSDLVARGEAVTAIPGVGQSIGGAIAEIVGTGTLGSIGKLSEKLAPGTLEIAEAAGIPVRDAGKIVKELKVSSPEALLAKLREGGVGAQVGARLEWKLRQGLEGSRRVLWEDAAGLVENFKGALASVRGVKVVEAAGSFRRGKETVGTLCFVVVTEKADVLEKALSGHGGIEGLVRAGPGVFAAGLAAGPRLRVRVSAPGAWGNALVEETGAGEHLAQVKRAGTRGVRKSFDTEEAWYGARGLAWIPPELREGRGEVEAAREGTLPRLIELKDILGDLHCHTTASDGASSIIEMVDGAKKKKYEYIAITDHSQSLKITNGLTVERLTRQMDAIDAVNKKLKGFRVLKGSEVDILEDGSLDFPDSVLKRLDVVMGSIHSRFALDKERQTQRLLKAIANPWITCVGHLTGRLLLKRPGYELDLDKVLAAVKKHGKLLEINSSPDRLDIDDELAQRARGMGISLLVNTDAHSIREFEFMKFGVQQARRGWQSSDTVLNTLPLAGLMRGLAATRKRATSANAGAAARKSRASAR